MAIKQKTIITLRNMSKRGIDTRVSRNLRQNINADTIIKLVQILEINAESLNSGNNKRPNPAVTSE